jgi:hypothetical protein
VQHIADDGDRQLSEILFVMAQRIQVEQPLRGVRMAVMSMVAGASA